MVNGPIKTSTLPRISHAGGGIHGLTYTNTYEAMDASVKQGFNLIELDFCWTTDEALVCLHDWDEGFRELFGTDFTPPLSLIDFDQLKTLCHNMTPCSSTGLVRWLEQNPQVSIITDIKDNNLKALSLLKNLIPNFKEQLIPQIYQPADFPAVVQLGYQHIIWTLYDYAGDNQSVIEEVKKIKNTQGEAEALFAITMPPYRAEQGLAKALLALNISSYIHTINCEKEVQAYREDHDVTEVYTDFLAAQN